jgi:D-alanyl-D-alanine carboxypeptidase
MAHSSWGPGWPNCQTKKINSHFYADTKNGRTYFPGGVRNEICDLVNRLCKETVNRGYRLGTPDNPSYGCWGFACRAIRGSSSPSNHSWGLAVDINAPKNPMGSTLITDMPGWMPDLWNAYGFKWGGDYKSRPDAMHYEFVGSVADAARLTQVARDKRLGEGTVAPKPKPKPKPKPEEEEVPPTLVRMKDGTAWMITPGFRQRVKGKEDYNLCLVVHKAKYDTATNDCFTNIPDAWILDHVDVATL